MSDERDLLLKRTQVVAGDVEKSVWEKAGGQGQSHEGSSYYQINRV